MTVRPVNFVVSTDGATPVDDGTYLTVWKKIDGRWMVVHDSASTHLPLPAAH